MANEKAALDSFVRTAGISVRLANRADGGWLLEIVPSAPSDGASALAVIFDWSDSSAGTGRLIDRLPGLLAGWPREMPVWAYALSDDMPLREITAGTVGHVQDGSLDLSSPAADRAVAERYRPRGSFLAPAIAAIEQRMSADQITQCHAILVGDGRLTDFTPVTLPASIKLLALVESSAAAERSRSLWSDIAPAALLCSFDDRRVEPWFTARKARSASHRWLRITSGAADGVRRIDEHGTGRAIDDQWVEYDLRTEPLRLQIQAEAVRGLVLECRRAAITVRVDRDDLALADRLAVGAEASTAKARDSQRIPIVFDTAAGGSAPAAVWQWAVSAFALAEANQPWHDDVLVGLLSEQNRAAAIVCLANRKPTPVTTGDDRLIILAIESADQTLAWPAGKGLPFGTPRAGWLIQYDRFEDRWVLQIASADGPEVNAGRSKAYMLHPTASQLLPGLAVAGEPDWVAAFSGPICVR